MNKLRFQVQGTPVPVGSYTPRQRKDGSLFLLRMNSSGAKQWRRAVLAAAMDAAALQHWPKQTETADYTISLSFLLPRPKTVRREQPTVKPDIDKLCRGTLDALTQAGTIDDDARVTQLIACKTYAMDGEQPGARITIINTRTHRKLKKSWKTPSSSPDASQKNRKQKIAATANILARGSPIHRAIMISNPGNGYRRRQTPHGLRLVQAGKQAKH